MFKTSFSKLKDLSTNPRINTSQPRSSSIGQPSMCRTESKNKQYLHLFQTKMKREYFCRTTELLLHYLHDKK